MTTKLRRCAVALTAAVVAMGLAACDPWFPPPTLAVTSTAAGSDAAPGDGVCEVTAGAGDCTLSAAVEEGNARGAAAIEVPPGSYPAGHVRVTGDLSILRDGTGAVLLNHTVTIDPGATLVLDGISSSNVPGARFVVAGTLVARHVNLAGLESIGQIDVGASGSAVIDNSLLVHVFGNRPTLRNAGTVVLRGSSLKAWSSVGVNTPAVVNTGRLIAVGTSLQSCSGTAPESLGYNNDDDGSCALAAVGDLPGSPPDVTIRVGTVVDYDLNVGSPLIDAIPVGAPGCDGSVVDDLAGVSRPQDGDGDGAAACDIGAKERFAAP